MKKIITISFFLFFSIPVFSSKLWKKTIVNFEKSYENKPKISYLKMESITLKSNNSSEIWYQFKYENEKKYQKVLKILKNGKEKPLSEKIKNTWSLVKEKNKNNDKKSILLKLFRQKNQKNLTYTKLGKPLLHHQKLCQKYKYIIKGSKKTTTGIAYIDIKTALPVELRLSPNSKFMKKSKDSYILFKIKNNKFFAKEIYVNMNINFFGKSKELVIINKNEY